MSGPTPYDVARRVFPDASDRECEDLIVSRTGWPCFWRKRPAEVPIEKQMEASLTEYWRALHMANLCGGSVCDFCNNRVSNPAQYLCISCAAVLATATVERA